MQGLQGLSVNRPHARGAKLPTLHNPALDAASRNPQPELTGGSATLEYRYYLLVATTSATAAAATVSRAIMRAVGAQPALAARPISVTRRPSGPPRSSSIGYLLSFSRLVGAYYNIVLKMKDRT